MFKIETLKKFFLFVGILFLKQHTKKHVLRFFRTVTTNDCFV